MDSHRIVAEHALQAPAASQLEQALYAHNRAATGFAQSQPVVFSVRDENGGFCGGVAGYLWGGWLHVTMLWVQAALRGQGLGRALLRAAEAYAYEQGCFDVFVSSFDFQAPGLYHKLGYVTFGQLADYPRGHSYHFLHKRLTPEAVGSQPGG